jgi:peptidoglycan LD-endopeptidase LytH
MGHRIMKIPIRRAELTAKESPFRTIPSLALVQRLAHQMLLSKTFYTKNTTYLLAVMFGFFLGNLHGSKTQTSATAIMGNDFSGPTFLLMSAAFAMMAPTIKVSPIAGIMVKDLHDSFNEIHHGHRHEAIDIVKPRGTPVRAVVDGTIKKIFFSRAGGKTIYEFDRAEAYCFYYAHLDGYASGLHEGQCVSAGEVIGYTGSTGNASPDAPHLHFAIYELGPDKHWWQGRAVDPYPMLKKLLQNND